MIHEDLVAIPHPQPSTDLALPEIYGFVPEQPSLFSLLCQRRGWTPEYLAELDNPSCDELLDLPAMVAALHRVRTGGEQIVVLPDFDMDGISAGVLGWAGLNELGFDAGLYVPDYRRGHDVTAEAVAELHQQFPGATTVITCDGGVNSHAGIAHGKALGLTMLVTDHHVQLDLLSPADVVVDPERIEETYSHPGICGAFVLHQVLMAYARTHRRDKVDDIAMLALFAGVGTVSDVMPLLYENRELVRRSLSLARLLYVPVPVHDTVTAYDVEQALLIQLLRAEAGAHCPEFLTAFQGFAVCLKAFREHGKLRTYHDLDEGFYGFYLAPAFNSIRRIEGDMADAFGVFTMPAVQDQLAAMMRVIEGNERRKETVLSCMADLAQRDQPLAPWVYLTDAPAGMLGLMASRLMQDSQLPVVVVRDVADPAAPRAGSARSPFWFKVVSTMTAAGFTAVGHENACGVRMAGRHELEAFAAHLRESSLRIHQELTDDGTLSHQDGADMVLGEGPGCDAPLDDLESLVSLATSVERLTPFGHGFPRPRFDLVVDLSQTSIATLGQEARHLKIVLRSGLKLLWWDQGQMLPELEELASSPVPGESTVVLRAFFSLSYSNGESYVQATITQAPSLEPGAQRQP